MTTDYPYVDSTKPAVVENREAGGVGSDELNPGRVTVEAADVEARFRLPFVLVSIAITPDDPTVAHPGTEQLTATATISRSGSTWTEDWSLDVDWASATAAKATIDDAGLVTTVAAGTSVVTASYGVIEGEITVTVTGA